MDVSEAVQQRKSIRAFKTEAVPVHILREIVELALRAPSWANTQPWELAIVSGEKLELVKQATVTRQGVRACPDFPGPEEFPEPFKSRFANLAASLSEAARGEEGKGETPWYLQGPLLYKAPAVIYVCVDRALCYQSSGFNVWPVFDCGLLCENIMLLALQYGLGTIAQAQAVHYPDVLRETLGLPETKLILLGIAIGYPDRESPMYRFHSEREPVDGTVRWYGSEG